MNLLKGSDRTSRLTVVLFVIYLMAICWILLFKLGVQFSYMENRNVNLIPFREAFSSKGKIDLREIIMNMVIFVPLGLYTGVLFEKWGLGKNILFFLLFSLFVEGFQFAWRIGTFDITDIITNTAGAIVGLMLFKAIEKLFKNSVKAKRFLNIIAAAGTVLMILFLVLLKTNNLWIKYQ